MPRLTLQAHLTPKAILRFATTLEERCHAPVTISTCQDQGRTKTSDGAYVQPLERYPRFTAVKVQYDGLQVLLLIQAFDAKEAEETHQLLSQQLQRFWQESDMERIRIVPKSRPVFKPIVLELDDADGAILHFAQQQDEGYGVRGLSSLLTGHFGRTVQPSYARLLENGIFVRSGNLTHVNTLADVSLITQQPEAQAS